MKLRQLMIFGLCLAFGAMFSNAAAAERRVALVIGNSAYKNASTLPNTTNDSYSMEALFKSIGFDAVFSRTDLGVVDFKRTVREFLITAENADIAVVYYAGHGIEISGTNYLIPVDAKLSRDYDVDDEAIALDRIIWALQPVRRLRLILLDACRDNPFATKLRSAGRATSRGGLAKLDEVSADTLVAYAAKAGSISYDGDGFNSPYATALLRHLAAPGVDIRIALGRVRDSVIAMTGGRQEPFIYGSLGGTTIALVPLPDQPNVAPVLQPAAAAPSPPPVSVPALPKPTVAAVNPTAPANHAAGREGGALQTTAWGPGGDRAHRPLYPRRNAAGAFALQPCARRDRQAPARGRLQPAAPASAAPLREFRQRYNSVPWRRCCTATGFEAACAERACSRRRCLCPRYGASGTPAR